MTLEGRRLGSGVKAPTKSVGVNAAARHGGQAQTVPWGVRDARSAPQSIRIKAVRAGDFIAFTRIKPHARWKGQSVLGERWFVTFW